MYNSKTFYEEQIYINPLTYGGRPIGPPLFQRQISKKTLKC